MNAPQGEILASLAGLQAAWRSHEAWVKCGKPNPEIRCASIGQVSGLRCELHTAHEGDHFATTTAESVTRHWNTV